MAEPERSETVFDTIDAALQRHVQENLDEPATQTVTGWVTLFEVMDIETGIAYVTYTCSDRLGVAHAVGIVQLGRGALRKDTA